MGGSVSHQVQIRKFEDFDSFRTALGGCDRESIQLSPGRLSIFWEQIVFDDIVLSRLRTDRKLTDRSIYAPDRLTFVICLAPLTFCGIPVPSGSIIIFGPGREYRTVVPENFESFEISMTNEFLQTLDFAGCAFERIKLGPERSVIHLSPRLVASLRAWSANFLTPFRSSKPSTDVSYWASVVRERTLQLLRQAICEGGNIGIRMNSFKHIRGWDLTSRALAVIEDGQLENQLGRTLSISDVSDILNCTPRALQYAFLAVLGISPKKYLLARRLNFARSKLVIARDTVTRSATENDFMHFGRFSQYYRFMFAERPSDTVRRAKSVVAWRANPTLDSSRPALRALG